MIIGYDGFKKSDVLPPGLADLCCCIELHKVTPFGWVKQHSLGLLVNLMIFIPPGSVALSHPHKKHMLSVNLILNQWLLSPVWPVMSWVAVLNLSVLLDCFKDFNGVLFIV